MSRTSVVVRAMIPGFRALSSASPALTATLVLRPAAIEKADGDRFFGGPPDIFHLTVSREAKDAASIEFFGKEPLSDVCESLEKCLGEGVSLQIDGEVLDPAKLRASDRSAASILGQTVAVLVKRRGASEPDTVWVNGGAPLHFQSRSARRMLLRGYAYVLVGLFLMGAGVGSLGLLANKVFFAE